MATLINDTHRAILALQKQEFSAKQAEGIVNVFDHMDLSGLSTKGDIQDLRLEMYRNKLDLYKAMAGQTVVILGAVIAILQFIQ